MTTRGNPAALALGPGKLYIGPLGTTEPADLTTDWASVSAAWVLLGYTDTGSEFKYALATDPVEVAEELDPISNQTTGRTSTVTFALAEITATNLQRAMNGGTITSGSGIVTFEPPDLGTEVRTMLGFESEDATERWVYRQCYQTGDSTITRAKGAAKATISCEFTLEKPATGAKLYKAIMQSPLRA
jgi:hypothetical protein